MTSGTPTPPAHKNPALSLLVEHGGVLTALGLWICFHIFLYVLFGQTGRDEWEEALHAQFPAPFPGLLWHSSNPPLHSWLLYGLWQMSNNSALALPLLHFGLLALFHYSLYGCGQVLCLPVRGKIALAVLPLFWPVLGWDALTLYTHSVAALVCTGLFLLCLLPALLDRGGGRHGLPLAAGLALGAAIWAKYGAALILPGLLWLAWRHRGEPFGKACGRATLVAGLMALPLALLVWQRMTSGGLPAEIAIQGLKPVTGFLRSLEALGNLVLMPLGAGILLLVNILLKLDRRTPDRPASPRRSDAETVEILRALLPRLLWLFGPGAGILFLAGAVGLFPRISTHHGLVFLPLFALAFFCGLVLLCERLKGRQAWLLKTLALWGMVLSLIASGSSAGTRLHSMLWQEGALTAAITDAGLASTLNRAFAGEEMLIVAESVRLGGGLAAWLENPRQKVIVPGYDLPWPDSPLWRGEKSVLLLWTGDEDSPPPPALQAFADRVPRQSDDPSGEMQLPWQHNGAILHLRKLDPQD